MRKLSPILLIGTLSMLFAEVFAGSSQVWFFDWWGIVVVLPLYLVHVLFLLWIALKIKKISLSQLYLFGVIFGLYESWITKVLWAGYIQSAGPSLGTFLELGVAEFPVLVFFWHPIMSFIVPILTFEILTKKIIITHEKILEKTTKKTILLILFLISISTFIANGNQFNLISANLSLVGTFIIIFLFYLRSKQVDLNFFKFGKKRFLKISIYILILYLFAFPLMFFEKIPKTAMPFISIIFFYAISMLAISKSKKTETKLIDLKNTQYSSKNLVKFAVILLLATNIACIIPQISFGILVISYYIFIIIGTIIFIKTIFKTLKQKNF